MKCKVAFVLALKLGAGVQVCITMVPVILKARDHNHGSLLRSFCNVTLCNCKRGSALAEVVTNAEVILLIQTLYATS